MPNAGLDRARHLIAESLSRLEDGWTVEDSFVRGPAATSVHVAELHGSTPGHLDVGFILDRRQSDAQVIWDCTTGIGETDDARLSRAVETWVTCTAPVFLEFRRRDGRFADHYEANHPDGFSGWHAIHGPFLGWGVGDGKDALQRWALGHPLLPQLRSFIEPALDSTIPNGVKFLFGAVVWWVADNTAVPAVGLSKRPSAYPPSTHAYALSSHLVYGFVTESIRRVLRLVP